MPKVSVIIPFHNVESYIEQCLDSVLNQTLKDIEVILIDDASDDNSTSIAEKYEKNDKRIKVLKLSERKGQGYARNRAIEIAKGEYIGFVDSDDFIKPEMFEKLYQTAVKSNLDITMCQAVEYDDVTGRYIESDYYSLEPLSIFKDKVFEPKDTKEFILDINVALWNKIYKTDYLRKIGEKFPEGFIYEDLPFFFGTYLPAKKIQIVWENFYVYRVRAKNSTMQQVNKKVLDRLPMVSLTFEKMKNAAFLADMKQRFQAWVIDDLFHRYTILKDYCQREYFFAMKKIFQNLEIENIHDDYWKTVYHFDGYLLVINNSFEAFNQQVFSKYLDIHKMEVRLRSQIMDREELQKNYAYTTTIFEQLRDVVTTLKSEVSKNYSFTNNSIMQSANQSKKMLLDLESNLNKAISSSVSDIINQTDEKISNIYSEITKNYDYTNNQISDLNNLLLRKIEDKVSWINSDVDAKISNVYSEITKNYDYVDGLNNNLNSSVANVYAEITKNYEYTNKLNQEIKSNISNVYDEISKNYEYTNTLSEKAKENVIESEKQTDNKLSKVYEEIENSYKRSEEFAHSRYKDIYSDVKDLSFIVHDEQMTKDEMIANLQEQLRLANERIEKIEKKLFK